MRVVAGSARGRRLVAPSGTDVRPTSDRVREAIGNALGSLDAIAGARVLDLFAGSGALGIEALSRGAAEAVFVDRDRAARSAIEANLAATGFADHARVVGVDADRFLAGEPGSFDLAFLDPPYAFDEWEDLLPGVPAALVVIETDRRPALPPGWEVVRSKTYGTTLVLIARPPSGPAAE